MHKKLIVFHGMNLSIALGIAPSLGCEVRRPRRTGDVVVRHPRMGRSVRCNVRRKDAPRELTAYLLRLQSRLEGCDGA